jgi:sugar diacid utilization regulator
LINLIDVSSSKDTLEYLTRLTTISRMAESFTGQVKESFKWPPQVEQEVSVRIFSIFRTFFSSLLHENSNEYLTSLEFRNILEKTVGPIWHDFLQYMEKNGSTIFEVISLCRVLNEILFAEVENGGFSKLDQFQSVSSLIYWMAEQSAYLLSGSEKSSNDLTSFGSMGFQDLISIVESVRSPVDLQPVFQMIVNRVRDSQLWPMCAIGIADKDDKEIRVPAQAGFNYDYPKDIKFRATGSATLEAIQRNRTVAINDVHQNTEFPVLQEAAKAAGYRSILLVPILVSDIRAVVTFGSAEPHVFTDEEILLAEAIAQQVMIAIENAQYYEQEKQRVEQLESLNHLIAEQNKTLQRAREIHTALTNLVLDNAGMSGILYALRVLLGNPTAIEDHNYQLLYYSDDDELFDKHRHASIAVGGTTPEALKNPRIAAILEELKENRRAVIIPTMASIGIEKRRLVAPIIASGDILGYVWVMEALRPFDEQDVITIEQAGMVLALEMVKQRAAFETELRIKADFLDDLLMEKEIQNGVFLQKSNYLGYNIGKPSLLFVIDNDGVTEPKWVDQSYNRQYILKIQRVISGFSNENIVSNLAGQIVVILPAPENHPDPAKYVEYVATEIREVIKQFDPAFNILVGVSDACMSISDIRQAYSNARKAIEIAKHLKRKDKTLRLSDLGIYGILYNENNYAGLKEFVNKSIDPLIKYDSTHKTELTKTLQEYLENQSKLSDTARQLYIHVNTLRQRLERIEELLGIDLQDPVTCLNLQLALHIYQVVLDQ